MKKYVFYLLMGIILSCQHDPMFTGQNPVSTSIVVNTKCANCPTDPICPVVDDILVNSNTTYTTCNVTPNNQGTWATYQNNCIIWTPAANSNQIVNTCIIACTNNICDTTYITIFPPIPGDTSSSGAACDPSIIYFDKDVMPILTANCAYSGCHNATSAKEGIILDTYVNVIKTGKIKTGTPSNSKLYQVLIDNNPKNIMPPPPATAVSSDQIKIISTWISQGAKNIPCDENSNNCKTSNISYSNFIRPLLASCTSCHKATNKNGGIVLDTYQGFKNALAGGKLYGSLSWSVGFIAMPPGGVRLSDCNIKKVKSWIDAGGLEN